MQLQRDQIIMINHLCDILHLETYMQAFTLILSSTGSIYFNLFSLLRVTLPIIATWMAHNIKDQAYVRITDKSLDLPTIWIIQ